MTTDQGFELHPGAAQDITEICKFIADDSPFSAKRVREEIALSNVRDFLIAYAPDESPIVVIAVIHGRRSPRLMAAILRGRK